MWRKYREYPDDSSTPWLLPSADSSPADAPALPSTCIYNLHERHRSFSPKLAPLQPGQGPRPSVYLLDDVDWLSHLHYHILPACVSSPCFFLNPLHLKSCYPWIQPLIPMALCPNGSQLTGRLSKWVFVAFLGGPSYSCESSFCRDGNHRPLSVHVRFLLVSFEPVFLRGKIPYPDFLGTPPPYESCKGPVSCPRVHPCCLLRDGPFFRAPLESPMYPSFPSDAFSITCISSSA